MQTHDVPGTDLFWGVMKYPEWVDRSEAPRWEMGSTSEIEYPHRWGTNIVIRLLFGWALVIGQWVKKAVTDEEVTAHLERAVRTDTFGITEPDDWEMEELGYDREGTALRPIGEWE